MWEYVCGRPGSVGRSGADRDQSRLRRCLVQALPRVRGSDSNDVEPTSGSVGEDKPLSTRLIESNAKCFRFPNTDVNIDIPRGIDAKKVEVPADLG